MHETLSCPARKFDVFVPRDSRDGPAVERPGRAVRNQRKETQRIHGARNGPPAPGLPAVAAPFTQLFSRVPNLYELKRFSTWPSLKVS
jgi:hypothetical protein